MIGSRAPTRRFARLKHAFFGERRPGRLCFTVGNTVRLYKSGVAFFPALIGRIDAAGKATVGLMRLEAKHAFANIALTDNVVRFATRRYCDNPLIVQGPGAGPEVTAAGVFSDLLRLSAYLGAHI